MLHEAATPSTTLPDPAHDAALGDDVGMLALQYAVALIAFIGALLLTFVR